MKTARVALIHLLLMILNAVQCRSQSVQPTYNFITNNGTITITGIAFPLNFKGPAGPITVPSTISGLPVTGLGQDFSGIFGSYLTSVTIPGTITSIGDYAFEDDVFLTNITFLGNAPACGIFSFETHAFQVGTPTTAYFMTGTSGWVCPNCGILSVFAIDGVSTSMLPSINFTVSATNGLVPLTVQINSSSVDSQGSPITRWTWTFGDGATSSAKNPSHIFTNVGTYAMAVVETNNSGLPIAGSVGPSVKVSPFLNILHSFN